jgi:methylthioribose-1-phosphate isomerase
MPAMFRTVERTAGGVRLLDQRRLPGEACYVECRTPREVVEAMRAMVVRGAPAIGVAAAYALAMGASGERSRSAADFARGWAEICATVEAARPTAVNLRWAVRRMDRVARDLLEGGVAVDEVVRRLEAEAASIEAEDLAACRAIGRHGADLVPDGATVLTHCNAGGLATAGYGTALGVVRGAVEAGRRLRVLADETRPLLQGARLTAWELMQDGIETVVIVDGAAGSLMQRGEVQLVVVGADRIAANGDVANKIGTYPLAVLAREHGIPFYVAAPLSTFDPHCPDGAGIPIEQRDPDEVVSFSGQRVAPPGVGVFNPAFDVTPARLISAIVTDRGVARPPLAAALAAQLATVGASPTDASPTERP